MWRVFFSRLQGKMVNREGEDKVIWMESKNGTTFIKASYSILKPGRSISFPMGVIWNS